jgi:hypothetical protein
MTRLSLALCVAAAALLFAPGVFEGAGARGRPSTAAVLSPARGSGSSVDGPKVPATVPAGFVGVVVDGPAWPDSNIDLAQQLDLMVSSGVESVRAQFNWASAQPYSSWAQVPAGELSNFVDTGGIPTDFASFDQLVGLAAERGLTVLPVILNAPSWDGRSYKGGTVVIPRSTRPYAAFAGALVQRYGLRGTFWSHDPYGGRRPIRMWQIWNEPNIHAFWPHPYYAGYLALLRAARAAIKRADPTAKVVLAGLTKNSWLALERIYKIRHARNLFDVVSVHPYMRTPRGVITILGYVRQVMDHAGDFAKPILADEISWPSSLGHTSHNVGYDFATTEAGQAHNIGELLPMLVRDRASLGLAGFYYYDWAGLERPNYIAFDFSGLLRFDNGIFVPKPALGVFRSGALAMEGCSLKGPLATDCTP